MPAGNLLKRLITEEKPRTAYTYGPAKNENEMAIDLWSDNRSGGAHRNAALVGDKAYLHTRQPQKINNTFVTWVTARPNQRHHDDSGALTEGRSWSY